MFKKTQFQFLRFTCRYTYRKQVIQGRKLQDVMGDHRLSEYAMLSPEERQKLDEKWAEAQVGKQPDVRNVRSDAEK